MNYFVTWYESEKAELIEDILDENNIPIDMLSTPPVLREQDVMVCKDCFQLLIGKDEAEMLMSLSFPNDTKCFTEKGEIIWEC